VLADGLPDVPHTLHAGWERHVVTAPDCHRLPACRGNTQA
jgi:hypothetical protein